MFHSRDYSIYRYICLSQKRKTRVTTTSLIISTSNELVRVTLPSIVYISSDGNYSVFTLIDRSELIFSFNLQHCQEMIVSQLGENARSFLRIGKSLIINREYIFRIHPAKQQLVLASPDMRERFNLNASKEALRKVKQLMESEI